MADFDSILEEARQLSCQERVRLIEALWELIPPDVRAPLHEDWAPELERRIAAIEKGSEATIPWKLVRAEALKRIGYDNIR